MKVTLKRISERAVESVNIHSVNFTNWLFIQVIELFYQKNMHVSRDYYSWGLVRITSLISFHVILPVIFFLFILMQNKKDAE